MLHRLILTFALAFLLGFSQQSALLHEISHFADIDPVSQDQAPQHASACDQCLGFSNLAHAIGSGFALAVNATLSDMPAPGCCRHHVQHPPQFYTARAPPFLV